MRFGKSAEETANETSRGGGDYIRYMKTGDTTLRILQEPSDWTYFWEHFIQGSGSFPCTNERETCPGCTSDNDRVRKAGKKAVFNALQTYNGTEYVNAWKVPITLADKLKNRFERNGTIVDRDYTISKYKGSGDKIDFDVEAASAPSKVDMSQYEFKDVEELLYTSYTEMWGDPDTPAAEPQKKIEEKPKEDPWAKHAGEDPPSEASSDANAEVTVTEEQLRGMTVKELKMMCLEQLDEVPPAEADTPDRIVDWMITKA